jgi:hypothetical protein
LAAFVTMTAPPAIRAQEPSLETALVRAAAYVTEFQRRLSGIVAEESYAQNARSPLAHRSRSRTEPLSQRKLKSDFLLVRPAGADLYVEFRDVFEVDGSPVRDRQDRLIRLFLDPSASAARQINEIVIESARYNIGNVWRTVNTPTLALSFLHPAYQPRFTFTLTTTETTPVLARGRRTSPRFAVSTDVWVIEFREVRRNTVIKTTGGKDLPSEGRFWIEPTTGRVLVTELIAEDSTVRGTVDVSYQSEPVAGLLAPIEMRERYEDVGYGGLVEGTATYSRFRQFQVRAAEQVEPARD